MDTIAQIDAFFAGKPKQWTLFEALRLRLAQIYPQATVRVMKTCIVFEAPKPFCYVSYPRRGMLGGKDPSSLLITLSQQTPQAHPRFSAVVPVSGRRYTVHLILQNENEIDDELLGSVARSRRD